MDIYALINSNISFSEIVNRKRKNQDRETFWQEGDIDKRQRNYEETAEKQEIMSKYIGMMVTDKLSQMLISSLSEQHLQKTGFCLCENKGAVAAQLYSYLDSTIPLLRYKISS